jgi:ABC-type transport system substrate-binding protein
MTFVLGAVAQAADPAKTIRVAFPNDITGLDPHAVADAYSSRIERAIFDSLFAYDFLKRPYALVPSTAASLPEISDGGRTLVIRP